jgi:hypothetical protein
MGSGGPVNNAGSDVGRALDCEGAPEPGKLKLPQKEAMGRKGGGLSRGCCWIQDRAGAGSDGSPLAPSCTAE